MAHLAKFKAKPQILHKTLLKNITLEIFFNIASFVAFTSSLKQGSSFST